MKKYSLILLTLVFSANVFSQKNYVTKIKAALSSTPWVFEIGSNAIQDNGRRLSGLIPFNSQRNWNAVPYPSRLSINKSLLYGCNVQLASNYNTFTKINNKNETGPTTSTYEVINIDLNFKYNINELIWMKRWISPYLVLGYGYTKRGLSRSPSNNLGLGINFWFYKVYGINVQGLGKWTLKNGASNYAHISLGFVYKVGSFKNMNEDEKYSKAKKHIRGVIRSKF